MQFHRCGGDMAVFRLPSNPDIDYVKRIVGLPGDRIQIKGGVLHINGTPVNREPVGEVSGFSGAPLMLYRETLPDGRSYVIAELSDDGRMDETDEYSVPEGHYFALGDNRDNSQDSRFLDQVGYIPDANLIGRVGFLLFNTEGAPTDNRPEEIPPSR